MITRGVAQIGGRAVDRARLSAGDLSVTLLSYGAVTQAFTAGGQALILSYDDPEAYGQDPYSLGAIVGRVANRIAGGRFTLHGRGISLPLNDGPNHLHGGPAGLSRQHWQMEADSAANALRLSHVSPDGAGGYPGRAVFTVTITLSGTRLDYDMRAEVDRATPINLAQHNYYSLAGAPAAAHELCLAAESFLPTDRAGIPTGARRAVAGTRWDFRVPRLIGSADPESRGLDHCMVLTGESPAATLTAPGAPRLRFFTDQPGMQLYTGAHLGAPFAPFGAVCLEPEGFPDALNRPDFPSVLAQPDAPYHQTLSIEVT